MAPRRTLEGIGYTALGLGFLFQAAKAWGLWGLGPLDIGDQPYNGLARRRQLRGLADGEEAAAMERAGGGIEKVATYTVRNIRERVSYIQDRIRKDSLKPIIREKALSVLTRKCYEDGSEAPVGAIETSDGRTKRWCVPEKDHEAEVVALFRAVRDANSPLALRYTRDHVEVDQYHAADKLLGSLHGGDCDDGTILLGSMLRAVGYQVRLRVIQDVNSQSWSHIYLLCGIPAGRPGKWVPLDWSMPGKPPGWEAPGAKEVAKTGKPSGVVKKLMDFTV